MKVDVKGALNAMRAEATCMLKNGGSAIVNTASVAAKHAVIGLTMK